MAKARRPDEEQNPLVPQGQNPIIPQSLPVFNFFLSPTTPFGKAASQLDNKITEYIGEESKARRMGLTVDFRTGARLPIYDKSKIDEAREKVEKAGELAKNPPKPKKVERKHIKPAEYGLLALGALLASALKVNPEDIAEFAGAYLGTREKGLEQKYQEEKEAAEQEHKTEMLAWEAQMKHLVSSAGFDVDVTQAGFNANAQIAHIYNNMMMERERLKLMEAQGERADRTQKQQMERNWALQMADTLNPLLTALNNAIKAGDPLQIELAAEALTNTVGFLESILQQGVFETSEAASFLAFHVQRGKVAAETGRRAAAANAPVKAGEIAGKTDHSNFTMAFADLTRLARYFPEGGFAGSLPYIEGAATNAIYHNISFVSRSNAGDFNAVIREIPNIINSIYGSAVSNFSPIIAGEIANNWQTPGLDALAGGNAAKHYVITVSIANGRAPTKEELKRAGFGQEIINAIEASRGTLEAAVKTAMDPLKDAIYRAGNNVTITLRAMSGFFTNDWQKARAEIAVRQATRDLLGAKTKLTEEQADALVTEAYRKHAYTVVQGLHALRNLSLAESPNAEDVRKAINKVRENLLILNGRKKLLEGEKKPENEAEIRGLEEAIKYYTEELKALRDEYDKLSMANVPNIGNVAKLIDDLIKSLYQFPGGKK